MKKILLCTFLLIGHALAQSTHDITRPAVQEFRAKLAATMDRAKEKYPDLSDNSTAFGKEYWRRIDEMTKAKDPRMRNTESPVMLADELAADLRKEGIPFRINPSAIDSSNSETARKIRAVSDAQKETSLAKAREKEVALKESTEDSAVAAPITASKLEIIVEGKEVTMAGRKVAMPSTRGALIELLGQPSRIVKKASTLLVWDDLGFLAYEQPRSGRIIQLSVALDTIAMEFWPKSLFKGRLTLDGAAVSAGTSIDAINRAKKGTPLKSEFGGISWKIPYENIGVVITTANGNSFAKAGTIAEFLVSSE